MSNTSTRPSAIVKADPTMYIYELDEGSYLRISTALSHVLSQAYEGRELAELYSEGMSGRVCDLEDTITIKYIRLEDEED